MRDIDFLVAKESLPAVTSALHQLGYRQLSNGGVRYDKHHHLEPFFHQEKQVWVEVHHGFVLGRSAEPAAPRSSAGKISRLNHGHLDFKAWRSAA